MCDARARTLLQGHQAYASSYCKLNAAQHTQATSTLRLRHNTSMRACVKPYYSKVVVYANCPGVDGTLPYYLTEHFRLQKFENATARLTSTVQVGVLSVANIPHSMRCFRLPLA